MTFRFAPSVLTVFVALAALWLRPASAGVSETNHPLPGITLICEIRENPPTRLFAAQVNLANPRVRLRVCAGGPDPDGPGEWQTTLMRPTRVAAREDFDLVINGDFFRARGVKDAEGTNSAYRSAIWSAVLGPAVTDGKIWSTSETPKPCLVVHKYGKAAITNLAKPTSDDWQVLSGNRMMVEGGTVVPQVSQARHPRTAIGLDATGTLLILLVVDGRKPGVAVGMSYAELAGELIRLGCWQAFNLDGGGSSVMAIRDAATSEYKIVNEPTDGRERAVANTLGVIIRDR